MERQPNKINLSPNVADKLSAARGILKRAEISTSGTWENILVEFEQAQENRSKKFEPEKTDAKNYLEDNIVNETPKCPREMKPSGNIVLKPNDIDMPSSGGLANKLDGY